MVPGFYYRVRVGRAGLNVRLPQVPQPLSGSITPAGEGCKRLVIDVAGEPPPALGAFLEANLPCKMG